MILPSLIAALGLAQAAQPEPRPLAPGAQLRESLDGGERMVFSIEVPGNGATSRACSGCSKPDWTGATCGRWLPRSG